MRAAFNLDENLLGEAQRLTDTSERTALIHEGLRALIQRESARRLARLGEIHSPMDLLRRITRDPAVMGGRPCIRGMRVTVGTIVGLLAAGRTHEEILQAYPYLEADDIRAALSYAAWRTEEVELPLP